MGLAIALLSGFYFQFNIGTETLSLIFNSIVQSLIALVGLMAVVVVFKYQSMATREDRLLEELNKTTSDLAMLGGNLNATSGEDLINNINPHVPKTPTANDGFRTIKLRRVKQELEAHNFLKTFLGDYMIKMSIYGFTIVLLSFLALIFVPYFSQHYYLAISSLYVSLFFVADILRLVIKIIAEAVS